MSRTVGQLDRDLGKLERDMPGVQSAVADIKKSLGSLKGPDVASRLKHLETLPRKITTIEGRIDSLAAKTAKLSEKVKWLRYIALGAAGAATAAALGITGIKFDVQLIKVDLTLLKKIDEKNQRYQDIVKALSQKFDPLKTTVAKMRDSIFKERAERRRQEAAEKEAEERQRQKEKQREKEVEEELQRTIKGLPKRVGDTEEEIIKIKRALGAARDKAKDALDTRTGPSSRRKRGGTPNPGIGPVTRDVKDLRKAVDELVTALGGI